MGEFDLSLIREFRNRPAFYDRNSPLFKDKVFTAREWQLIANKLGYDVSLLKDRMLQLRNRYNLEKRRLEQLRDENPGKSVVSPWPLYSQLHFLSEHIRTRRSYKRMLPMHDTIQMPTPPDEDQSFSDSEYSPNGLTTGEAYPNGLVTVKMEEGDANNAITFDASGINTGPDGHANQQLNNTRQQHSNNGQHHKLVENSPQLLLPSTLTVRHLDTMRENVAIRNQHIQQSCQRLYNNGNNMSTTSNTQTELYHELDIGAVDKIDTDLPNCTKRRCLNRREQKYAAFGNFMSASLLELPPQKALLLLEKFTSEIVRVIIEKGDNGKSNNL